MIQRFHLNSREVKRRNEDSQRFHFNNSDEVKKCSELFQIFHFNSSEQNKVVSVVRDFILIVMK